MPASIKLQQEFGDDLQVIFVESQGASPDRAEAFAWNRKWMGTRAMWSTERPLRVEGKSLPKFALIGSQGELLLSGNPLAKKQLIEKTIASQIKEAKKPPEGTPRKLSSAWKAFLKGKVGAAITECDEWATDGELAEAAKALRSEMVARTQSRIAQSTWLADNGYVYEAMEQLTGLADEVKGCTDFGETISGQLERLLQSETRATEADATEALASVEKKMFKGKPFDQGNLKRLMKVAKDFPGTRAAERAERLVALAQIDS